METDYKVKLEVFEGPLDLLLYLIKRDEIDIYDISLERITRQYLEYLQAFKELQIDIAGNPEAHYSIEELSIAEAYDELPPDMRARLARGERGFLK